MENEGATPERLRLVEEMISKSPNDPFLNYAAGLEYKKIGEYARSKEIMQKITVIDEKYLAAYYQLGKLHENDNELDSAIKVYRKGIKLAKEAKDMKTLGELTEALMIIDADFDEQW